MLQKILCKLFTKNVLHFKRDVLNPVTFDAFKKFLEQEVAGRSTPASKRKISSETSTDVSKLINDLSFWVEVER